MRIYLCLLVLVLFITSCQSSVEHARSNSDVISVGNTIENIGRFYLFVDNVQKDNDDKIVITSFTDEGDPIYKTLEQSDSKISYTYNDSHDKHGGKNKGISKTTCTNIVKVTDEHNIRFELTGCKVQIGIYDPASEDSVVLAIPLNIK